MHKIIKTGVAGALLVLCGCSGNASAPEETIDAQTEYGCNVLNVFNAGEYIAEDVVSNFEKKYNAKVNYDMFESNEMLYTKLLGGSSYDVLVPSDYMIEQLMQEKRLQPIDKNAMTNYSNLDPYVIEMLKVFDPNTEYAVPYFWGSVGLLYNRNTVDEETIKKEGWNIYHNTDYKGRIYFYDSQRDGFMVAFKALGYSMNTDKPEEIEAAFQWLREMNATMEPAYVTDEIIDDMVNGKKDIAMMYSGDAAYVMSENPDMAWYEPDQGTNIWIDAMVIPSNASCVPLANEFINYIISIDVQRDNSEYVGYTSVDTAVIEELSSEDGTFFENSAYLPRNGYAKDEVFHYNEELKAMLADRWTKVKVNN
jgi:spermidine/putrescine transport system substrate-binding protein/spermidine/putrescine transport system permease protein